MAYRPKMLKEQELYEVLTPAGVSMVTEYFKKNPKKTVFKVTDGKLKITVRRYESLGTYYTLMLA